MNGQQAIVPGGGRGWENRSAPPAVESLKRYNPNRPDSIEGIWQPFYDFQVYAMAGQLGLDFFQVPQGQGGKTLADTNMTNAGMFPNPTAFFCTGVMVAFIPGNTVSAANVTPRALTNLVDVNAVANSGFLELQIGSKVYLTDAPIGKFAPNFTIGGLVAAATATATTGTDANYARSQGRYYAITPFLIPPTQNFMVRLRWPALVPATVAGRIGVILDGFWYRQSQ